MTSWLTPLKTDSAYNRGATFVELILKVVELASMIGWFFILKNQLPWSFVWKALFAIGLGWLTTWILALVINLVPEKNSKQATDAAD